MNGLMALDGLPTSSACICGVDVAAFLGLTGTPLQVGLLAAVYGTFGLLIVSALWNAIANRRRRALLYPARVHRTTTFSALAAKGTALVQLLAFVMMVLPLLVTAAQFSMVIEDFASRYFELPPTVEAAFDQYKVFLGLFLFLLVAEVIKRKRKGTLGKLSREQAREADEEAARAIARVLDGKRQD